MNWRQLRGLCLSLPEVEERETWGESTFRVRERIFVIGSPEGQRVSIKASLDDQAGLIAMDPATFAVSAYTGRYGWVTVRLRTVGLDLMTRLVIAAWKRTATKRAVAQLEAAEPLPTRASGRRSRSSAARTGGSQHLRTRPPSR